MVDKQKWVAMGYIKGAVGIKGWLKIGASTEYLDGLLDYSEWQLRKDSDIRVVEIEQGKLSNGELQVKLIGVDNRDAAALLRGYTIEISREDFAPAEDDEFYWTDLVGMKVLNCEGILLGEVKNLMETGAHDILVVNGEYGQKLIPFVEQFIQDVNADTQTIIADWGLDY